MTRRWLRSPGFDGLLLVGPPLFAALAVLAVPALHAPDLPPWGWLLVVVGVDVAHVWSTLWRSYFHPAELSRRPGLYAGVPAACWAAGAGLYAAGGPLLFWRVLAYAAVFHFLRQQYGFLRLYQRLEGAPSRLDGLLDRVALYGGMLYPLVDWHAKGRTFNWFVRGDFLSLPSFLAAPALWLYGAALAAWLLRQAFRARRERLHPGRLGVVLGTAAAWYVGIVACRSDLAFTLTNVVAHGVPYFGLMWLTAPRAARRSAGLFLLVPLAAAYVEEGLWDFAVWREHAALFLGLPALADPALGRAALTFVVPLLALPQATHYLLDAWLWRLDGSNPGLAESLFGVDRPAAAKGQSPIHA